MTVYRDTPRWERDGVLTGHMIGTDASELQMVAAQLGLAVSQWHGHALTPHYRLPEAMTAAADALGVVPLDGDAFLREVARVREQARGDQRTQKARPLKTSKTARKPPAPPEVAPQGSLW